MVTTGNQALVARFEEFYLEELAREYPDGSKSLEIDWRDLAQMDSDLADDYINHPDDLREAAEEALRRYDSTDVSLGQAHVRVHGVTESPTMEELDSRTLNKLVSVTGTVDTAYSSESVVERAVFVCQRCGAETEVPQSTVDGSELQEPYQCESCERQGPFKLNTDRSEWVDRQEFKLRESPVGNKDGKDIESVTAVADDDLAGTVNPGDQITVVGVVRPKDPGEYTSASISDKYIEANSIDSADTLEEIEITEGEKQRIMEISQREDIYERMVDSFAPSVFGYRLPKLALLLQLFGGVDKQLPDGARIRGDIHILLVGDPGSAKTRLLQAMTTVAPKALRTNGTRTTSAGLTAAATRTSDGTSAWELEAGPIVLANEGHLAIDDLDHMPQEVRASLNEPMEEQSVTASKGDANEVLSARTSITAAANPKYGRFDRYEPIGDQIDLDHATISRFDLIFLYTDVPDLDEDGDVASHILDVNHVGELTAQGEQTSSFNLKDDLRETVEPAIEIPLLRKYIAYARRNCNPTMTEEAKEIIENYYVDLRAHGEGEETPAPVTARKLESLIRLAEASARVRLSDEVTTEDASRVVSLTRSVLQVMGVDPESGQYEADVDAENSGIQHDREAILRSIISKLQDEHGEGAPVEEVIHHAEKRDLDPSKAEHEIEKLKEKGELYQPNKDHLRVI